MRTDDGSIIYECLNGEPGAFGVLVDKYKEGIYASVYDKLRDFQDAQDVTQEVFLQAYRGLRSLRRWESFGFWLYRIAYARCSQWLRTESRRADRDFIADQDSKVMDARSLNSYREDQLSESLREGLDLLPETYREVLMLHYFGGMNSKEIARAIGTSPGAITVMSLNPHLSIPSDIAIPTGLPLPVETEVLKTGEIPVDILKVSQIPAIASKKGNGRDGTVKPSNQQKAFHLAPAAEGGAWTAKDDMPTARHGLSTSLVNGKIYAIGGRTGANELSIVEEYTPEGWPFSVSPS
jgi:RNA polymerase sigma-70 factor (ECF subfamily)